MSKSRGHLACQKFRAAAEALSPSHTPSFPPLFRSVDAALFPLQLPSARKSTATRSPLYIAREMRSNVSGKFQIAGSAKNWVSTVMSAVAIIYFRSIPYPRERDVPRWQLFPKTGNKLKGEPHSSRHYSSMYRHAGIRFAICS